MGSLELIYACKEKLGHYKLNKIFYARWLVRSYKVLQKKLKRNFNLVKNLSLLVTR
jgi:hypothetical protein